MTRANKVKLVSIVRKGKNEGKSVDSFDLVLFEKFLDLNSNFGDVCFDNVENRKRVETEVCNYIDDRYRYFSRKGRQDKMEEYQSLKNRAILVFKKLNEKENIKKLNH